MTVSRRSVVKSAGAFGAAFLAPGLPMWALADEKPGITAPSDYLGMSSALLGIDAKALVTPVHQDDISMADTYYTLCNTAAQSATAGTLSFYDSLVAQGKSPAEIATTMLQFDAGVPRTDNVGAVSRLTMLMWLYGLWYGGTEVNTITPSKRFITEAYQVDFVISSRAYKNGWIWRIAQAHPMGFSHFKFGSWSEEPPALSDYTGIG